MSLEWSEEVGKSEVDKWHEWRSKGIGGSDIAAIMGASPYKNIHELWEEKALGKSKKVSGPHIDRGNRLEPFVREMFNERHGFNCKPENVVHHLIDFYRASLDGIDWENGILIEIKCPGQADGEMALKGEVPLKYWYQLQWQMLCTGLSEARYLSYYRGELTEIIVPRDERAIVAMSEKAMDFWQFVMAKKPPHENKNSSELEKLAEELERLNEQVKTLKKSQDEIKEKIQGMMKEEKEVHGGFIFTIAKRKGNVNYSSIEYLKTIDLEPFRGEPTFYLKVTRRKEE